EGLETRRGNTVAKKSELIDHNVEGGFPAEVQQELSRNKRLARETVRPVSFLPKRDATLCGLNAILKALLFWNAVGK
ncbi:MAG: hypothetical protein HY695_31955, partial [Deltaproteobacteria bacterium]|nr:hypothetical protein [Deltaproteobacteria bacterium]